MVKAQEFPDEGELVIGKVRKVKGFGVFVALLEYPDKEGLIPIKEVAHGWVKYIRDYVREGNVIVCKVLRVSPRKGHIDLSLKQVNEHQKRERIQEWKNEQRAERLMELVAEETGMAVDKCFEEFGYDLISTFGTLYSAFEETAIDKEVLKEEDFEGDWIEDFAKVAKDNISPPHVTIKGILNLTCPGGDGVLRIKEILQKGETLSDNGEIKIRYVGSPKYRITIEALDYKTAEDLMDKAKEQIIEDIEGCGGEGSFEREDT